VRFGHCGRKRASTQTALIVATGPVISFLEPPPSAGWQHREARSGFEVVFLRQSESGLHAEGDTAAVEAGEAWAVHYEIELDAGWVTRGARVRGRSARGPHERTLEADGGGGWRVDGAHAPHLDGCLDVDLESSCLTNAFPVHRLGLAVGEQAGAPAAYVRALDLSVERLEQHYTRLDDDDGRQRYHYAAPAFDFRCELVYDEFGLLLDYPGIGTRASG
jgi:hypothetical protein